MCTVILAPLKGGCLIKDIKSIKDIKDIKSTSYPQAQGGEPTYFVPAAAFRKYRIQTVCEAPSF